MKPKILVLDNDPPRHVVFRAAAADLEVVHTYAVSSFAEALREEPWPALICLDHDLGGGVNAGRPYEHCGCDAAELVVRLAPAGIPVLIHSGNTHCAQVMRRILIVSGRVGRVSRVNIVTVTGDSERAGVETMREAIQGLLASPQWPEDLGPDELLELLGDEPGLICPVKAARE